MKALTLTRLALILLGLLVVLGMSVALGLTFGSSTIDLSRALNEWLSGEVQSPDGFILVNVRFPRVVMAVLVGAALATVGAVYQGVLLNPLADPYILGVSGGASVAVVLAAGLGVGGTFLGFSVTFGAAFLGAVGALMLIYSFAAWLPLGLRGQHATYVLLLTGVVFNAFAMAVVLLVRTLMSPIDSQRMLFWMIGNLSSGGGFDREFVTATVFILTGLAVLVLMGRHVNLLALGEDTARSLGVRVFRTRLLVFVASSLVVGAAVAQSGMIGFVGLVVPHALRLLLGGDNRLLIPASVLGGAAFLVLADLLGRVLFPLTQSSLPVGAITALVGVPLFFVFLLRHLRQGVKNG